MKNCSVCHKEFEDQYFDTEQNKCILHSDKSKSTNNIENFCNLLKIYIEPQSNTDNSIYLKDICFPLYGRVSEETNYENILNKFQRIIFRDCIFYDEMELKKNIKLRFDKCTFNGTWKHIFCKEIVYSKCTFDTFEIDNIAEDKIVVSNHMLYNCQFKHIDCRGVLFKKKFFKFDNNYTAKRIHSINLIRCEFEEDFILTKFDEENSIEKNWIIGNLNFEHSIFHKKAKLQFCNIRGKANFYNTKFMDLADFYRTTFNQVLFERTDFDKISVFSEVIFNCDLNFKYTKFIGKGIFRDTVIKGKLNLRDTIFDDDANFLDVTSEKGILKDIQVENRETARVIKSFYDKSNNIIEANKFYALEMKEREKELSRNISKNPLEWIIFKIHGVASDHSQSWILALFWMAVITIFSIELSDTAKHHMVYLKMTDAFFISILLLIFTGLFIGKNIQKILFIIVPIYILYALAIDDWSMSCFAERLSSFTKFNSTNNSIGTVFYKITMAYLVYQFVISVRQNTRRK